MSTLRVNNITDASGGSSALSVPGAAKAWVNFNGTGTVAIRASLNTSSITDNGTGDYTVNFASALATATYSAVVSSGDNSSNSTTARLGANTTFATGSFRFRSGTDGGFTDTSLNNVAIFN
jgi:hypothetical protein